MIKIFNLLKKAIITTNKVNDCSSTTIYQPIHHNDSAALPGSFAFQPIPAINKPKASFMKPFVHLVKTKLFAISFLFAFSFLSGNNVFGQTLISDFTDYPPGAEAVLTGSGFQPYEAVRMQVLHANGTVTIGADHDPWFVTADSVGNFITTWHVCEDDCVGETLRATADGQVSNLHAELLFTDAPANGDFRSVASGNWNALATWEFFNTSGWVAATSFPGQGVGTGNVLIRNGHTIDFHSSTSPPTNAIGSLTIGEGVSGQMNWSGNDNRTLTVTGDITINTGGNFNPAGNGGNLLNVGGGISNLGTFDPSNGADALAVVFNGTNQTISGSGTYSFNDITFSNSGTITLNSNITVSGIGAEMSVGANCILTPSATVQINGAAAAGTISGSGTINVTRIAVTADYSSQYKFSTNTLSSLTVDYAGAGPQSINALTYGNLKTSNSDTKTMTAATVINGNVTIGVGTTLDEAAIQMTLSSGSVLTVNGTLDFTSSTGLIRTGNNVNATLTMGSNGLIKTADDNGLGPVANASLQTQGTGTWTTTSISTNGTVEYNRNTASAPEQTITERDYNNLAITGSLRTKTLTLTGTRNINGNLVINTNAPLIFSGAQNVNVTGNWTNSGTFTAGTGTVTFNGSSPQTIGGSAASNSFTNLAIANTSGGVSLTKPATATGNVILTSGILTTDATNILSITNTSTTAVAAGSNSKFIKGPLKWSIGTGTYVFPVGKSTSNYLPFKLVTSASSSPVVTVEAFDSDAGAGATFDATLSSISHTEYWQATLNSGTFTGRVSLTRPAALTTEDVIGKSSAQGGSYTSIGGTAASPSINNSDDISSFSFFVMAAAASCPTGIGAPSPSSQTVCNNVVIAPISTTGQTGGTGAGFTYKWYTNGTINSNSGGTAVGSVNGGETQIYTPPATTTAGTTYYYVVVSRGGCNTSYC